MKYLIALLIITIAAVAGFFVQPRIYSAGESLRPKKVIVVKTIKEKEADAAREAAGVPKHDTGKVQDLMAQLKTGTGASNTPPATQEGPKTASTDDEIERKYPMPKIRAIEDITKNWTSVPSAAFPRKVKSVLPIDFQVANGKTTLPPGSDLVAFSLDGGMMSVARGESDPLKVVVSLASTDFQEMMTRLYTKYVDKRVADVKKSREAAIYLRDNPAPPPPPVDQQAKLAGERPAFDGNNQIPVMMASIAAKEVTEFKSTNITDWSPPEFVMEDGKGCWSVKIGVEVSTIFGPQPTEVQAFINNGKVIKWIYAGSKEPVQ
jgi:hypothetical protein